jgi:G3E family GTPase
VAASAVTPVTVLAGFAAAVALGPRVASVRSTQGIASGSGLFRADATASRPTCTCCPLADDLVRALRELHAQRTAGRVAFERVIVEVPGQADLRVIMAALAELAVTAARFAPAAIIVAADGDSLESDAARAQVAMADRIAWQGESLAPLTKTLLRALNPGARIESGFPADWRDTGLYRGDPPRLDGRDWARAAAAPSAAGANGASGGQIRAFSWRAQEPLEAAALESTLESLVRADGDRLLRMKGLAAIRGESGPRAIHAVGHTLYPSARLAAWPEASRASSIAFSGRGLEEAAIASILDSLAHS